MSMKVRRRKFRVFTFQDLACAVKNQLVTVACGLVEARAVVPYAGLSFK